MMAYTCSRCGRTSHHPTDEQERFCGACGVFEDDAPANHAESLKRSICVMVELLTDHPLLNPDALDVSSAEATMALRQAVVEALPDLVGVVMVVPTELAKLMAHAHDQSAEAAGFPPAHPPASYKPPHANE